MAKLTLHELMKELADDPGLEDEVRARAGQIANQNHSVLPKQAVKTEPRGR